MYSCHSKPRSSGYWARNVAILGNDEYAPEDGWTWIDDRMTKQCMYDNRSTDPKCEGCTCE